ncbi:hypothetical protein [Streptomyces sp. NPDC048111]|uniref:hypothetical protein n=1 Tax=Streptomyces sp. NPDC048111 TaxID=3365500 RepID=UPI003717F872
MVVRVMNRSSGRGAAATVRPAGARGIPATVVLAVLAAAALIATGTPSGAADVPGGAARAPGPAAPGPAPGPATGPGAEADLSYHGHVSLWNGRTGVWLVTENHGPAAVTGATVRLRFSVPLDSGAALPPSCLRTGPATVQCGSGSMRAAGSGPQLALDVAVVGNPDEITLDIDTVWNGGANDRNPANNTHRVLAPATGDAYTF